MFGVCLGCAGGVLGGGCLGCAWVCLGCAWDVLGCAWGVPGGAKLSCQTFMVDEGEEEEEEGKDKIALIDHRLSPMVKNGFEVPGCT